MKIVLIGFMGSGKSTVAPLLARHLGLEAVEMDDLIMERAGGQSIAEIFASGGESRFRELEAAVSHELRDRKDMVISTGGGVVINDDLMDSLTKGAAAIIHLDTVFDKALERVGADIVERPLFADAKKARDLYELRRPLYDKYATIRIDMDSQSLDEAVRTIIGKLKTPELCMIIGDPVAHSLSPQMHNAGYRALDIDDEFTYVASLVKPDKLASFMRDARTKKIKGISCTQPHKITIMKYLDEIDGVAQKIGAINTLVNEDGRLKGYNTDWLGIVRPLQKLTSLKGKKVALLGAGGAARAAVYGLTHSGAKVTIYNRTPDKARSLAREFGAKAGNRLEDVRKADIIVNTASVSSQDDSPLDKKHVSAGQIVFDIVYEPRETRLLKDARQRGARVIYGREMLLYQGMAQFELFTGRRAPEAAMRKALR